MDMRDEIKNVIDQAIADQIDKIPGKVSKVIEELLNPYLGVHKSGPYRYDFNASSPLYGIVSSAISNALHKEIDASLAKAIDEARLSKTLPKTVSKIYREHLKASLIVAAKKKAEVDAAVLIDSFVSSLDGMSLGPDNQNLCDPDSFKGPLGQIMLESAISEASNPCVEININ